MGSVQPSPHSSPGPHSGVSALTVQGLPPVDDDLAIVAADSGKETINDARAILGHVAIRCHILVSVCPCHPTRQHWEKLKRGERGGEERGFKAGLQGAAARGAPRRRMGERGAERADQNAEALLLGQQAAHVHVVGAACRAIKHGRCSQLDTELALNSHRGRLGVIRAELLGVELLRAAAPMLS